MSALETNQTTLIGEEMSTIDSLYEKFTKSVIRSIGSTEFYEFFMDAISRADNEFQFSNRKMEKIIDIRWVNAIEQTVDAMQRIVANPRNVIKEEELVVNVANARKAGSDVVRHLAQHGQLVDNFDQDTGDVQPNKLMQKYREDSEELYENRLAFTTIEMAHHFVKIRYDALNEAIGDEMGAKLKIESNLETAVELMHFDMYMHIKEKESALEIDEKKGDILSRIERLNRLLTSFVQSPYGLQMAKLNRVRGNIVKTNILKKNPSYKKITDLYDFLRKYDEVGYVIKITEQNPEVDEVLTQNIFHNILFQYIVLKGYLEDAEDRKLPTPLNQRKRELKPKVIKEIIEELTDDYDVPDLEIRKVLIEELTKEQLMLEEEAERLRLVEEAEQRRKEEEERQRLIEEEVQERLRKEKEAEEERLRLEQEEKERLAKVAELEQKLEDERRKNIFMAELEYFSNHLYDHLDERSQIDESMKDIGEVEEFTDLVKEIEAKELAERLAIEFEEEQKRLAEQEEKLRIMREEEAEQERIRVETQLKQQEDDRQAITPYLDEVRNFQVMLASRRQLRIDQKEEERQQQEFILLQKQAKEKKKTKKWRFFK